MSRVRRFALPSLPYFAAGLAAALVIGLAWVLPATQAGTADDEVTGVARTVHWDGSRSRFTRFEWTSSFVIEGPPSETQVHPRLDAYIEVPFTEHSGEAGLDLDVRVFINGVESGREVGGHVIYEGPGGGGSTTARKGIPQFVASIRQSAVREGENTVQVQADIRLNVITSGSQDYIIRVGPLHTTLYQADGDGDGVVDAHQLVAGVHTGWIAIPAATLAGTGAWFLARSVRARMAAKEPLRPL